MRYLAATPRNEADARIEDGVYAEPDLRITPRSACVVGPQTPWERLVEDARWASRSGPVRIVRPATLTAISAKRRSARTPEGVAA